MEYEIKDTLSDTQIVELFELYQSEWWTKGRTLPDIRRALEHSDILIAFCHPNDDKLLAFARVLTDCVYKALILDVIVKEPFRQAGLGAALMNYIIKHPVLMAVKHFELYCAPEMKSFYEKWGFTNNLGQLQFMRLTN